MISHLYSITHPTVTGVNLSSITDALGDFMLYIIACVVHRPVFSITDFMAKECAAFLL